MQNHAVVASPHTNRKVSGVDLSTEASSLAVAALANLAKVVVYALVVARIARLRQPFVTRREGIPHQRGCDDEQAHQPQCSGTLHHLVRQVKNLRIKSKRKFHPSDSMDWLRNAAAKAEETAREAAKKAQEKLQVLLPCSSSLPFSSSRRPAHQALYPFPLAATGQRPRLLGCVCGRPT